VEDEELVERARVGDVDAYEALVRRYQDVAFRTAYVICGNAADAEEAAQDGFLKAYRALGRFRAGDAVGYSGEALAAWGKPEEVLTETMARVAEGCELLTCIAGDAPPLDRAGVEARAPDGVEVEYHEGGQSAWWWLLCAE
jgi:hypothetical protein